MRQFIPFLILSLLLSGFLRQGFFRLFGFFRFYSVLFGFVRLTKTDRKGDSVFPFFKAKIIFYFFSEGGNFHVICFY